MQALLGYPRAVWEAWAGALAGVVTGGEPVVPRAALCPTARDVVFRDGTAAVYRFRRPEGAPLRRGVPLLLVPSMINRWYVLDLRRGSSVVEALTAAGIDTYLLDWGVCRDEDRYLTWDLVLERLARCARRVCRDAGAPRVGVLGYCMGATLAAIHAALHPERVACLVNLAGPIDFSQAGVLGELVDPRWFDARAVARAGNVAPSQMQQGFTALRPTLNLSKLVGLLDRGPTREAWEAFDALETWGSDNVPFPAAAYETYITELYQQNLLARGEHRVGGRRVDLKALTMPVLTLGATRDTICPLPAAEALVALSGSRDTASLRVPGGHVGAVVGSRAARELYPALVSWLGPRLDAASSGA
ncbi:MAG: alpha/beta fold hydrolase [Deltaproteobacteria bacterium]|nr:alpha/beta fold hydrolase [Deltaproteobacteria bacterium]